MTADCGSLCIPKEKVDSIPFNDPRMISLPSLFFGLGPEDAVEADFSSDPNCAPARPFGALVIQGVVELGGALQLFQEFLGGIISRPLGFNVHGA